MKLHSQPSPESGRPKVACTWLLLGICGAGMRAFAEMLLEAGEMVIGSDQDAAALSGMAFSSSIQTIPWSSPERADFSSATRLVHSLAVSPTLPFLETARSKGLTVLPLPAALGLFLKDSRQICVAGTHGKTTTSGMLWWILQQAGLAPAGYIGGIFQGQSRSGSFGQGRIAVVESCEYRQAFLQLDPSTIVLTGIEPDHFDCFPTSQAANLAYRQFIDRLQPHSSLLVNSDNSAALEATDSAGCAVVTFGRQKSAEWSASALQNLSDTWVSSSRWCDRPLQAFEACWQGRSVAQVSLQVPGLHNIDNALGALAASVSEGIPAEEAARHLGTFPGIRRRFEYRGNWNGVDLFDDYAHHPSAIRATLKTAQDLFPGRRIIAVFEPHQVSRTENLFSEFTSALTGFDECLVLPVLPARESRSLAYCCRLSGRLVRQISEAGGRAFLMANLDQVPGRLDHSARTGDVVITMGAGRTNQIHDEINRRLHRDSAA